MKPKNIVLIFLLLSTMVFTGLNVYLGALRGPARDAMFFGPLVLTIALTFLWVYYDAYERHYDWSPWLKIGVIALSIIFVPVYLARSRPRGQRLAAFRQLVLFCLAYAAASLAGGIIGTVIRA